MYCNVMKLKCTVDVAYVTKCNYKKYIIIWVGPDKEYKRTNHTKNVSPTPGLNQL